MQILKFGGTSIGTSAQIKRTLSLIDSQNRTFLVFSAIGGITNILVEFIQQAENNEREVCCILINRFNTIHKQVIDELFSSVNFKQIAVSKLNDSIKFLEKQIHLRNQSKKGKEILAQGEILSCTIIYLYLLEQGVDLVYLPALKFMITDKFNEPDYEKISEKLNKELNKHNGCKLFITNGYLCLNNKKQIDNLNRGGSDYTATIIGSVLNASHIEIWTDIDGLQNNDPRYVENTIPVRNLTYDEAGELAYFGAKILHPLCIIPAQKQKIPIVLKNTFSPVDEGTFISEYSSTKGIKAIAAKDGITAIKIKSGRMMHAYGFLSRIFEIFEKYKTSVDMLTTSEISVSMTIDNTLYLESIITELEKLGEVEIDKNQTIVCIVGNFEKNYHVSIQNIIKGLGDIPVRMISFGASKINISILIDASYKIETLNLLNHYLFRHELCLAKI